jgi:transcriptional regulator with XRE-family HTH domain
MLNSYPGPKLRNLRQRALLTQMQVVELTGISETTIHYLEHGLRRPQTQTLEKLLGLYAMRISRLEKMERLWGPDGTQKPEKNGASECQKSLSPSPSQAPKASTRFSLLSERY